MATQYFLNLENQHTCHKQPKPHLSYHPCLLAPPNMAAAAPFGTDLQPLLRPKIICGRLVHVKEDDKKGSEAKESFSYSKNERTR